MMLNQVVTQCFIKHLLKRNNKEISAYLRDKQIECFTFNTIQHQEKDAKEKERNIKNIY